MALGKDNTLSPPSLNKVNLKCIQNCSVSSAPLINNLEILCIRRSFPYALSSAVNPRLRSTREGMSGVRGSALVLHKTIMTPNRGFSCTGLADPRMTIGCCAADRALASLSSPQTGSMAGHRCWLRPGGYLAPAESLATSAAFARSKAAAVPDWLAHG